MRPGRQLPRGPRRLGRAGPQQSRPARPAARAGRFFRAGCIGGCCGGRRVTRRLPGLVHDLTAAAYTCRGLVSVRTGVSGRMRLLSLLRHRRLLPSLLTASRRPVRAPSGPCLSLAALLQRLQLRVQHPMPAMRAGCTQWDSVANAIERRISGDGHNSLEAAVAPFAPPAIPGPARGFRGSGR